MLPRHFVRYALLALALAGIDRFLKWQALHHWSKPKLLHPFFGWSPFFNPGVAFGLPLPNWLIISLTLPIIVCVAIMLGRAVVANNNISTAATLAATLLLVLLGALSNLLDRLYYAVTVDYFQLLTGVINVADIMIVGGLVAYFWLAHPPQEAKPSLTF